MIKHISIIQRPAGMSREEHVDYWLNVHAPLIRRTSPRLKRYVINLAVPSPEGYKTSPCDGIVETCFEDMQSYLLARSDPSWLSAERKESSKRVIDFRRFQNYLVEEHVIPLNEES